MRAERNLERTEIRAPYDAMIDSRNIGLGSFVGVGNKIGHVLATQIAQVRLPIADNQLAFLENQGIGAKVNLLGVFAGKASQWQAKIVRSEGVVDNKSRMGYLVAEINDPYQLEDSNNIHAPLRFGSYVNAQVIGNNIAQATVVPRHLVNNGKVAILDEESKLLYVAIDIVRQQGSDVIVANGLAQGDRLIISALDYPIDGMKLTLITDETQLEEKELDTETSETQMANNKDSGE